MEIIMLEEKLCILGSGYVGAPLALCFANKFKNTVCFDLNEGKVNELKRGYDRNHEIAPDVLKTTSLTWTSSIDAIKGCTFYIVAVPTPIDHNNVPDLTPLVKVSEMIGSVLSKGTIVCYESTVYPGVTEEVCGPILEKVSGLRCGIDFKIAYSPERINPGDKEHTLETIVKIVSGQDKGCLDRVATVYGSIIRAGVHRAESIKVAEAAKVIENSQRDLNIAFMNELAIIFDRIGIRTMDVLKAAGTKWNFGNYRPGLVGGNCISVDPYYLTMKAQQLGYQPEVMLAGRRINNNMGAFIASKTVKLLISQDMTVKNARIGILGLTFKENCRDLHNSKVPDIIKEIKQFGIDALVHDPIADVDMVKHEFGITLSSLKDMSELDGLIIAVSHKEYLSMGQQKLTDLIRTDGVMVDVKSVMDPSKIERGIKYWSL